MRAQVCKELLSSLSLQKPPSKTTQTTTSLSFPIVFDGNYGRAGKLNSAFAMGGGKRTNVYNV